MSILEVIRLSIGLILFPINILIGEKFNKTKKYTGKQKLIIFFSITLISLSIIIFAFTSDNYILRITGYILMNLLIFWLLAGAFMLNLFLERRKRKSKENIIDDYIMLDVFDKEFREIKFGRDSE